MLQDLEARTYFVSGCLFLFCFEGVGGDHVCKFLILPNFYFDDLESQYPFIEILSLLNILQRRSLRVALLLICMMSPCSQSGGVEVDPGVYYRGRAKSVLT